MSTAILYLIITVAIVNIMVLALTVYLVVDLAHRRHGDRTHESPRTTMDPLPLDTETAAKIDRLSRRLAAEQGHPEAARLFANQLADLALFVQRRRGDIR